MGKGERRARALLGLACGGLLGLLAPPNAAQAAEAEGPVALQARATAGAADCPATEGLVAMINRLTEQLATRSASAGESPSIVVSFDRDTAGYHGRIEAVGRIAGVREIDDAGATCAGLASALAVTVAVLVEPTFAEASAELADAPGESRAGEDEGDGAREASRGSRASRGPADEVRPESAASEGSRDSSGADAADRLGLELGALVALGVTHSSAFGSWLGLRASQRPWTAHARAVWLPTAERDVGGGTRLRLRLVGGQLRLCRELWSLPGAWPSGAACADALAGALQAEARGVDDSRQATVAWVGVGGGLKLLGNLVGPLFWQAEGAALAPLMDERFTVEGLGPVHSPPRAAGYAGFTLAASIW